MRDLLKIMRALILIAGIVCISFILIKYTSLSKSKLIEGEFLFTLLGVLLGFAFTLLTFIISMIDKVKEQVIRDNDISAQRKAAIKKRIDYLYIELKEDIYFIFITFIIVGFSIIVDKIDFPFSEYVIKIDTNKHELLSTIKFSIFILNLYVIYDLLGVTFSVSEVTGIPTNRNN